MSISISVEPIIGSGIDEVARDMINLATKLGVMCVADFNTVALVARPGDDPSLMVDFYYDVLLRRRRESKK